MDLRLKQAGCLPPSAPAPAPVPVPVPAPGQRNETPRQSGKRPMRSLTAEEKVSAIDRVHNGESKAAVARDMGVPESTLRGWCKSEEKLRSQARNSGTLERSPIGSPESERSTSSQSPSSDNLLSASGPTKRELSREDTSGLTVKRARYDNNATSTVGDLMAAGPASNHAAYFNGNFRNSLSNYVSSMLPLSNMSADLTSSNAVRQHMQNQKDMINSQMQIIHSILTPKNENGMQSFSQLANSFMTANLANTITINGLNNNSATKNKRKNNHSTQIHTSKASTYKHRLSPDMEKPSTSGSRGASPIASTSANNGPSNEQTPVRPARESRGINDIVRHLMAQQAQQQQLQQSSSYTSEILNLYNTIIPTNNAYERAAMLDNIIGNNNTIYNTNENGFITDIPESQRTNLEEAVHCAEKLLNFLDRHGQPIFTFTQVDTVRNIFVKLREHKDKNELKKNEIYTS